MLLFDPDGLIYLQGLYLQHSSIFSKFICLCLNVPARSKKFIMFPLDNLADGANCGGLLASYLIIDSPFSFRQFSFLQVILCGMDSEYYNNSHFYISPMLGQKFSKKKHNKLIIFSLNTTSTNAYKKYFSHIEVNRTETIHFDN
jgi:hypothetical protein